MKTIVSVDVPRSVYRYEGDDEFVVDRFLYFALLRFLSKQGREVVVDYLQFIWEGTIRYLLASVDDGESVSWFYVFTGLRDAEDFLETEALKFGAPSPSNDPVGFYHWTRWRKMTPDYLETVDFEGEYFCVWKERN